MSQQNLESVSYQCGMNFADALRAWREILGENSVHTSPEQLQAFSENCSPKSTSPLAVLEPRTTSQVQAIVRVAAQHEIPLYSISAGLNIGYGGGCPAQENNVVVSLKGLDSIELDPLLGYAVIGPGVTQGQLEQFLEERGGAYVMDASGAPPGASFIGNILERGHGHSRYGSRVEHCAGMEVVLGDGQLLRTGFGRFEDAAATHLYSHGLGPSLDGMFSQSNFGIVVKLGIWLMPRPSSLSMYSIETRSDTDAGELIELLGQLRREGVIDTAVHVLNDMRLIGVLRNYPFGWASSQRCLTEGERRRLQKEHSIAPWTCVGGLQGDAKIVRARLGVIRSRCKGLARVLSLSEKQYALLSNIPFASRLTKVQMAGALLNLQRGKVSETPLKGLYWRKKDIAPKQPLLPIEHRCGVQWCSPVIPTTSADFSRIITLARAVSQAYEFDCNVSVNLVTERASCCVIGILFDKSSAEETQRAEHCYQKLTREAVRLGYPPYRVGAACEELHPQLFPEGEPSSQVIRKLKRVFDPHGVLAPGRYGIQ